MMESAFDVIFKLADGPIKHIENIIKKLAVKTGVKVGGLFKIPLASQSQSAFVEPMDFESIQKARKKKQLIILIVRLQMPGMNKVKHKFNHLNIRNIIILKPMRIRH